jgi:hypothetical protein
VNPVPAAGPPAVARRRIVLSKRRKLALTLPILVVGVALIVFGLTSHKRVILGGNYAKATSSGTWACDGGPSFNLAMYTDDSEFFGNRATNGPSLPPGTRMLTMAITENNPSRLVVTVTFDGPVPLAKTTPGTTALNVFIFFSPTPQISIYDHPYYIWITPGGLVDGAVGGKSFLSSSGFSDNAQGDQLVVTVNRAIFTSLAPSNAFYFETESYAGRYSEGHSKPELLGMQECIAHTGTTAGSILGTT